MLDFWGSWCEPCLRGMPEMKKVYAQYADRLEVVGIACNDTDADWKATVARLELPWIHVQDDVSAPENSLAARYGIRSYPTKIILAPDRTVVGFYPAETPSFYQKLTELLE